MNQTIVALYEAWRLEGRLPSPFLDLAPRSDYSRDRGPGEMVHGQFARHET